MILTALAERTLVFQITPWRDLHVSRTIEFRADQTLHDLHQMIHCVFDLDSEYDHLYAFFLNNRAWDRTFKCGGPGVEEAPHQAVSTPLGSLPLRKNKRFLYLFDFGDELRHEVRVVGEGVADANQRYPRVIESVGAAPPRYHHDHDEDEEQVADPGDAPPLDPQLAELVPGIIKALERYAPRRHAARKAPVRPAVELREEADLAFALLERSAGDLQVIHAVEHAVEGYVWGWLSDLPLELSLAGRTEDGLRLGERVHAIVPHPPMVFTLPLLFALAGRLTEARDHLERNLVDYPDDPLMLLRAGEAFHSLGDLGRAEEVYREAIPWVGDDVRARREIVGGLERVLHALGREDAIAELREAEQREHERSRLQESSEWPMPYRRGSLKVSRNDPCPCGSGKKVKRCCGTSRRS